MQDARATLEAALAYGISFHQHAPRASSKDLKRNEAEVLLLGQEKARSTPRRLHHHGSRYWHFRQTVSLVSKIIKKEFKPAQFVAEKPFVPRMDMHGIALVRFASLVMQVPCLSPTLYRRAQGQASHSNHFRYKNRDTQNLTRGILQMALIEALT